MTVLGVKVPEAAAAAAVKVSEAASMTVRSSQRNPRHPAAAVAEYRYPVRHILVAVFRKAPPPHLHHLMGLTARADSVLALVLLVCLLLHQEEAGTGQAEQDQEEEEAEGEQEVERAGGQDLPPSMMMTEKS